MCSSGIGGSSSSEWAGRLVREATVSLFAVAVGTRTDNEATDAIIIAVVGDDGDDIDNDFDNDNNEMGYLGELVSEYLIALEELDLIGITDRDVSKFASTSASSVVGNNNNKRYDMHTRW